VQPFLLAALPIGQLALGAQSGYQFGQGIAQVQNGDTASGALNIFGGALTAAGGVGYYANEAKFVLSRLDETSLFAPSNSGFVNPRYKIGAVGDLSGITGNVATDTSGKTPVQFGDVMTYGESKARAVVGDELTGDHIPAYAAIRQNVETTLGRRLNPDEAAALRDNTNTIIVSQDLHAAGRTYFGANTRAQIAEDSVDLGAAAAKDQAVHLANAPSMGYNPQSLEASFNRLNEHNQKLFNQLSTKQSIAEYFKNLGL
jgi:hypothetical protein